MKNVHKDLLKLSRNTLKHYFAHASKFELKGNSPLIKSAKNNAATFVTLTIKGELRGCVGNIVPKTSLYKDVINNTLLAAFGDSRFVSLSHKELANVKIEISVLSQPKRVKHKNAEDLLKIIRPKVDGLILQTELSQSTFLPQVWFDLPNKVEFLKALSKKAGLSENAWEDKKTEIFTYQVENFSE